MNPSGFGRLSCSSKLHDNDYPKWNSDLTKTIHTYMYIILLYVYLHGSFSCCCVISTVAVVCCCVILIAAVVCCCVIFIAAVAACCCVILFAAVVCLLFV